MPNEPRWRVALNWATVITFFSLPLVAFVLHLIAIEFPNVVPLGGHGKEFGYLSEFSRNVTILAFGLAGLDSFDKRSASTANSRSDQKGAQ